MPTDKIAIIDIGSNSVRLVIYEGLGDVPLPIFNEKAQCALEHGLSTTGLLNPLGAEMAYGAIARYMALIQVMGVRQVEAVATAAVRHAKDGKRFVKELKERYGLTVRIITGEEEAELAGLGVLSGFGYVDGVACDLGGGSLEVVELLPQERATGASVSLPLGVLTLQDRAGDDRDKAKRQVARDLEGAENILRKARGRHLYAIGGSCRALAKIYMEEREYPLPLLHEYTVNARQFRDFCGRIATAPREVLFSLPGLTRKRADTLMYAALVLRRLIKLADPQFISFSTQGIREGILYRRLVKDRARHDPLLTVAEELARAQGGNLPLARALDAWMAPVFRGEPPHIARIRRVACLMVTIPRYEFSTDRVDASFYDIVQAPLLAISHAERLLLGLAVLRRYRHAAPIPLPKWERLHSQDRDRHYAHLMGLTFGLAFTVSGGVESVLAQTGLRPDDHHLALESATPALISPAIVQKRLKRVQVVWQGLRQG